MATHSGDGLPPRRRRPPIPDFCFAEQAAAGLVTTASDLARFVAAALPGPEGKEDEVGNGSMDRSQRSR